MREHMPNGDLQRFRQIRHSPERHVALPTLDVRKVGAVYVGPPRQFLLRNSQAVPARPNNGAEPDLEVGVGGQNMVSYYHRVIVWFISQFRNLHRL
jgi:hypothetical protein